MMSKEKIKKTGRIVLASVSPRRKEILTQFGYNPVVIKGCFDEKKIKEKDPARLVKELSLGKAKSILNVCRKGDIVIGSDTIVYCDGRVLGKPKNKKDAFEMIKNLKGKDHYVYSGVTLILHGEEDKYITFADKTKVKVTDISDSEIKEYVNTGEPMDKAGSYAIQGIFGKYIEKINGDIYTVIGLPGCKTVKAIKRLTND